MGKTVYPATYRLQYVLLLLTNYIYLTHAHTQLKQLHQHRQSKDTGYRLTQKPRTILQMASQTGRS